MSADNIAICPRCLDLAKAEQQKRMNDAIALYGNVPVAEYEAAWAKARDGVDENAYRTFDEYHEFYGAELGVITASYSAKCEVCGLVTSFEHEHPFYTRDA